MGLRSLVTLEGECYAPNIFAGPSSSEYYFFVRVSERLNLLCCRCAAVCRNRCVMAPHATMERGDVGTRSLGVACVGCVLGVVAVAATVAVLADTTVELVQEASPRSRA